MVEIPTMNDLMQMENRLLLHIEEIKGLVKGNSQNKDMKRILTVNDVKVKFLKSQYVQRIARQRGELQYISGKKITYKIEHVESWINTQTIS